MTFILHIGKQVPKALRDAGWEEASAMHLGKGCWVIRLERKQLNAPSDPKGDSSPAMGASFNESVSPPTSPYQW